MKKITLVILLCCFITGTSFSQKEITAANGITYTLVASGSQTIPHDNYMEMRVLLTNSKDSVYWDNRNSPEPWRIKKSSFKTDRVLIDQIVYENLKVGDSMVATVPAVQFFDKLPKGIDPQELFTIALGVKGTLTSEENKQRRKQAIIDLRPEDDKDGRKQLTTDITLIETYLSENKIKALRTKSGLYYVIHKKGEGPTVTKSDTVVTDYTGFVLTSGAYFDTSREADAKKFEIYNKDRTYKPFETVIGEEAVIDGWDEGFQLLRKGAKATLYIPSQYAYGPRKRSKKIEPNSVLVFEVELHEIKKSKK